MRPPTSSPSPGFPAQLRGIPGYGLRRPRLLGKEGGLLHFSAVGKPVRAASTIYSAPIERVGSCANRAPGNRGPPGQKRPQLAQIQSWTPQGEGVKRYPFYSPFITGLLE